VVQPDVGDGQRDEQRELPSSHHVLGAVRGVERDRCRHPLVVGRHSRRGCICYHRLVQRLDDALGRNVLGAIVHDVELLAMLVVARARVRVGVNIDSLERPLRVQELHLLLLVALGGNL
jgi:hypothetical protein